MEYRKLPGTGLKLSILSLGTMQFGGQTSEADSLAIMDFAFENGINVFDTANAYTGGESEKIVGKGIKGRRDKIILATKAGNRVGEDINCIGLGRRHLISALDASLKRLDTDYVDIYYMHTPDYDTPLEESLETMSGFVKSGKVRYVGISNYASWQVADIFAVCDKNGYTAPVITQNVYNLITRGVEAELIPCIEAHDLGMTVYNPIAAGILAGKHSPGTPAQDTRFADVHSQSQAYYSRYWTDENFDAVEKLKKIAADCGMSILQFAMKWCALRQIVTSIIIGVSRMSQIEQNISLLDGAELDAQSLAQCDEIWRSLSGTRFAYNR